MQLLDEKILDSIRAENNCTDEEWEVIKGFLSKGFCSTKANALICYNNMLKNELWYKYRYNDAFWYKATLDNPIYTMTFFITVTTFISLNTIVNAIVEKKYDEKANERIEEVKRTLEAEINKVETYIVGPENIEENLFLNYVENLMNYILMAQYPGYQNDLAKIKKITHDYAANKPENREILDLSPTKQQECYSRLADIQLNAYAKINEVFRSQEAETKKGISNGKYQHLEQQLTDSIDGKVAEIMKSSFAVVRDDNQNSHSDGHKLSRQKR